MPRGGRLSLATANAFLDESASAARVDVKPGSYVVLSVRDTGHGMDAATRARVFEPFFTTKPTGTGLGLATVYGIVRQSGGHLTVESEVGRGTEFHIFLPRVVATVDRPTPRPRPGPASGGSETVLVVEDEQEIRALVCTILAMYGY